MTGRQFHEILLHDYHLQMEMVSAEYVLAMTAVGDSEEGYERLLHALVETDAKINAMLAQNEAKKDALDEEEKLHDWAKLPVVSQKMTIYDAEQRKKICAGWMMLQAKLRRTIFICIHREFQL